MKKKCDLCEKYLRKWDNMKEGFKYKTKSDQIIFLCKKCRNGIIKRRKS